MKRLLWHEKSVELISGCCGLMAEHAVCDEQYLALKPKSLSFEDAAALPLAAMTALHALRKYNGPLEGKTVFVPAGCKGCPSLISTL